MISLKRILTPTDFTPASDVAVRYGRALAEAFGGALHLLHVCEDPYAYTLASEIYVAPPPGLRDDLERDARARLETLLPPDAAQALSAVFSVASGSPFVEIVRYARAHEVDLIVIGTHGRGPIAHMLLGSVAEKVVRKAPCPVLTVRPGEHEFVMP
jgi:nucleotide-binding universal stress UspA family protein